LLVIVAVIVVVVVVVRHSLTHSLSRLVSDTGATTRRVRGTAAVVGVSCYLEGGRRKREKEQDHHRFFGDSVFYQVCLMQAANHWKAA
jgi:hypothetical protein